LLLQLETGELVPGPGLQARFLLYVLIAHAALVILIKVSLLVAVAFYTCLGTSGPGI
jgi:hypothetical protein